MEDDAILAALEKVKDWAMSHMLKSPDKEAAQGEELPAEEPQEEMPPELGEDEGAEEPIEVEIDAKPKASVLKRYDFAKKAPPPPAEMPKKRGPGRPRKS